MNRTSVTIVKALRRIGLGSLTGIALYLFAAMAATALAFGYTSIFTLGTEDWSWFTIGGSPAWFALGIPAEWEAIVPTYTVARIVLAIAIGLIIAAWEAFYIFKSEEVNWTLAFTVAIFGVLIVILSQVIWSIL